MLLHDTGTLSGLVPGCIDDKLIKKSRFRSRVSRRLITFSVIASIKLSIVYVFDISQVSG